MCGCSCGTAAIVWFVVDGGVVAAECSLVRCSASRDGGEAGDGCDGGDVTVQRQGTSLINPLLPYPVHLGGGRCSNCRHLVLQRWQLQTFQCFC